MIQISAKMNSRILRKEEKVWEGLVDVIKKTSLYTIDHVGEIVRISYNLTRCLEFES